MYSHENYSNNYDYEYAFKTTETFAGKPYLSNFTDITSLTGYETDYRTESYLGRIRYNYAEKYNLEVSFRRDGSSRFSKQNRWGNFGSIGANWIISEEDFMQSVTWINSLKFRANYGKWEMMPEPDIMAIWDFMPVARMQTSGHIIYLRTKLSI